MLALAAHLAATWRIAHPVFLAVFVAFCVAGAVEAAKVIVKLRGGMFAAIPAILVLAVGLWCVIRDRTHARSAFWSATLLACVLFLAMLDATVETKLDYLIDFSDEPELTQRFHRADRIKFLDIRRLPPTICARNVGLEVTANDAAYDATAHRVTYGLAAPGEPIRAYDLPASHKPRGALGFDYENTWKPGTRMTNRVQIFDVTSDPSCAGG